MIFAAQSFRRNRRKYVPKTPLFCIRAEHTQYRTAPPAPPLEGARGAQKPAASLGEAAGSYIMYYAFLLRRMPMRMNSRPNAVIIGTGHHRRPVWGRFSSGGLSGGDLGSLLEFCRVKVVVCKLSFEV